MNAVMVHAANRIAKRGPLGGRVVGLQVLVVERQVADGHGGHAQRLGRDCDDGVGELAVERLLAEAADDDGDVAGGHGGLFVVHNRLW